MTGVFVIQGRQLSGEDIGQVRGLLAEHPEWGRTRLGRAPGSACNYNNPEFGKLSGAQATGRQLQFGLKFLF